MPIYPRKDMNRSFERQEEINQPPATHPACIAETRQRLYSFYLTKHNHAVMMLALWVRPNETLEENFLRLMASGYAAHLEMWSVAEEILAKYDEGRLNLTTEALDVTKAVAKGSEAGESAAARDNIHLIQSLIASGFTLMATSEGFQVDLYSRDLLSGHVLGAPGLVNYFESVPPRAKENLS